MRIVISITPFLGAVTILASLGCGSGQAGASVSGNQQSTGAAPQTNSDEPVVTAAHIDSRFEARLREIAAEYRARYSKLFGGVRWAPELCRAPPLEPSLSMATAGTPHAQKLYYLFVQDADAYAIASAQPQPIGQAIVKESWTPDELKAGCDLASPHVERGDEGYHIAPAPATTVYVLSPHVQRDGKQYRPGKQADLFIMFKVEPDTSGTDSGWVYGTVTPDGNNVTSAGKIASCMDCHQNAQPDRVFGAKAALGPARD